MVMAFATGAMADSVITLTTAKEYGEMMSFSPLTLEKGTISIDWGDGTPIEYEVNPKDMPYLQRKEGKLLGQTVKIYGKLAELSCTGQQLTGITIEGQTDLKRLTLTDNQLSYYTTNLGDATHLEMLYLGKNNIEMLNLRNFSELVYLELYDNPELTTVAFADENPKLKSISMYNTDVVHFYDDYTFPELTSLDLNNASLWDITFTGSHYPKLHSINLSGNQIQELDVSELSALESLSVSNNQLSSLNLAANTELTSLSIDGNRQIKKLNLQNNSKLTSLNVSNTAISELDVHHMEALRTLYMDSLNISHIDLSELKWLQTFSAKGGQLSYLDFTANYFQLRYLYLQGNKNFTAQSLNFMFNTIHDPDRNGKIYVQGCTGAEQADPEKYLQLDDASSHWTIDVEGDASASMDSVQLTLLPATGGSFQVWRRDFAWNLERNNFAKYYEQATSGKVVPGFVNVVRFVPEAGNDFLGVKINGELVKDSLFFVTQDATVEAVFGKAQPEQKAIRFTVKPGITSAYAFAADQPNTPISIDWGDGELEQGKLSNNGWTWFDHQTEGTTVTVYGDVTYVNVESYPGFGTDNQIEAIDLSQNDGLHQINAYFNLLSSIDVSNQKELVALDISMNEDIEELDVTNCPLLRKLTAYGTFIEQLDLSQNPQLQYLDVKNTMIDSLDLSNAPNLQVLNINNDYLSKLDLSKNPMLAVLEANGNEIDSLNVSDNLLLLSLSASKNKLTQLDLSKNLYLEKLSVNGNQLKNLDLSNNTQLWYVEVRGNGWDACTVNDFFALMPEYVSPGEEVEKSTTATKLWIAGEGDGTPNDVAHAETLLMSDKGWIMNYTDKGDGTGCDHSYVYVLPTENGQVSLKDAQNNTVMSGTTVKKGTELTVVTTPDNGYELASAKANGQDIQNGKFTVNRLTDVAVKFQLVGAGIDGVSTTLATAQGSERSIIVSAQQPTQVGIVSLSGKTVYDTTVSGQTAIGLPAGIYVVTLSQNGQKATQKLIVK